MKSRRTLTLPQFLVRELVRHKGAQAPHRLQLGSAWKDHGLVITQEDGTPRTPDNLTHAFWKLAKRAGFPSITFHDLRQAAATLQIAQGVPLKVVSERLGHSSIHITADLYGHVLPAMDQEAARKTDAVFHRVLGA